MSLASQGGSILARKKQITRVCSNPELRSNLIEEEARCVQKFLTTRKTLAEGDVMSNLLIKHLPHVV